MKKITILALSAFLITSCTITNPLNSSEINTTEVVEKEAPKKFTREIPEGFGVYKNSAVTFEYPGGYKGNIQVKDYTFQDIVGSNCITKEITDWAEKNPEAVESKIIEYGEERHDYYKEVLYSIQEGYYEKNLNEGMQHFNYKACNQDSEILGVTPVSQSGIHGIIIHYYDQTNGKPFCSNSFHDEILLVKSTNEIISISIGENTEITPEELTITEEGLYCDTIISRPTKNEYVDTLTQYLEKQTSTLEGSPFVFIENRQKEIKEIASSIQVDRIYLSNIGEKESKTYISDITSSLFTQKLELPKYYDYDIVGLVGIKHIKVEAIYRDGKLQYKIIFNGDDEYIKKNIDEKFTITFEDHNDFSVAKQEHNFSDFTKKIVQTDNKEKYTIEGTTEVSEDRYLLISTIDIDLPSIGQEEFAKEIESLSAQYSETTWKSSSVDVESKNVEIKQISGAENISLTRADSIDNYKSEALIVGEVINSDIDKITVEFENKDSSFPIDNYTLTRFQKGDPIFEYKAYKEFSVFDYGINTYTVKAFIGNEQVGEAKITINSGI